MTARCNELAHRDEEINQSLFPENSIETNLFQNDEQVILINRFLIDRPGVWLEASLSKWVDEGFLTYAWSMIGAPDDVKHFLSRKSLLDWLD